jgi:hypothetical protein
VSAAFGSWGHEAPSFVSRGEDAALVTHTDQMNRTQFLRRLMRVLGPFLRDSGSLLPLRFRLATAGNRGFFDPRSFLPFQNRGVFAPLVTARATEQDACREHARNVGRVYLAI